MPTYEYVCSSCHHEWEAVQSMRDEALKKCPKCRRATAKRQISLGGGFILKGGGWYADLYSSSKKPGSSSSGSGSSGSGSGSSGSGSSGSGGSGSGGSGSGGSSSGGSSKATSARAAT